FAVVAKDETELALAELSRTSRDRVEDRLDVGRGARDDTEDLAGRRLLLESLAQLTVPALELFEEPHIRECDGGLIREGLEQGDLSVREGTGAARGVAAANGDGPDGGAVPRHRHREEAPVTDGPRHLQARGGDARLVLEVADVNDAAVENRLRDDARPAWRC